MGKCFLIKSNSVEVDDILSELVELQQYDLLKITEPSPKTEEINIVKDFLVNTSQYFDYKVLVFTNFDKVSVLNQNKLLKLIEENNSNTFQLYFIENESSIIDTIKSRLIFLDYTKVVENEFLSSDEYQLFETAVKNVDYKLCYIYLHLYKYTEDEIEILASLVMQNLANNERYGDFKRVVEYEKKISLSLKKNIQLKALILELM